MQSASPQVKTKSARAWCAHRVTQNVAFHQRETRFVSALAQKLPTAGRQVVVRDDVVPRKRRRRRGAADETSLRDESFQILRGMDSTCRASCFGPFEPHDSSTMNFGRRFVSSYVRPT